MKKSPERADFSLEAFSRFTITMEWKEGLTLVHQHFQERGGSYFMSWKKAGRQRNGLFLKYQMVGHRLIP
jgi:hypothetical protein